MEIQENNKTFFKLLNIKNKNSRSTKRCEAILKKEKENLHIDHERYYRTTVGNIVMVSSPYGDDETIRKYKTNGWIQTLPLHNDMALSFYKVFKL
jgi:hypothetical protein